MNGDLHSLGNPSAAAVRQLLRGRKRRRGGADSGSPTSLSSSAGADRGGPAAGATKRARTATSLGPALAAAVATLARTPGLAVPEARVPRDEDAEESGAAETSGDTLPAELAAAAAEATEASWRDWFLEDAQWQTLAALLDAPPARRYSGRALAFFLQHARTRPTDHTAFVKHAATVTAFERDAGRAMAEAEAGRPHRVLPDAQLDAIVAAVAPGAGVHVPVWRAFLRWMRPHGGAVLRWRANAAQRMLGDPVRRATLTRPPDVKVLHDADVCVRHHNRAIVPLVNGLRQQLRTDRLAWAQLRRHAASPAVQRQLGAAENALLHALLAAQTDMTICVRRAHVKKNPVALATHTAPAILLLPPALPPGTTFASATQQLLRPDGSDPWAAHYAAVCAPLPLAAPPPRDPAASPPHPATAAWVAATCAEAAPDHPGTRFAALWRLYAATVPDASEALLVAALQRAGFAGAHYAPPAPLPLCLAAPATLADARARLALLTDHAGLVREAALAPPSPASRAWPAPTTADDAASELSLDPHSVDFSD